MATETYIIRRRPAWDFMGEINVSIECDPLSPSPIKLGLAIRAAVKSGANLSRADLSGADLFGANLSRANLSGADLSGANLSGANLSRADLSGANLSRADLFGANLSRADLSRADLSGANLSRANLSRADLSRADLSGANLSGAKIKRLIACADRTDEYQFMALELEGGGVKIKAGCRWFTVAEFRAHTDAEYPDTDKHRETNDILDFIEARAKARGVALEPPNTQEAARG